MPTNGHLNPYRGLFDYEASPEQLRNARRKLKLVETEYRLKRLESLTRAVEAVASPDYWTSLLFDRGEQLRRDPWQAVYSTTNDRRDGKNFPIFSNEQELSTLRMQARILCSTNSYAIGLLEGLTSYILGTGCTYRAISRHKERAAPEELLAAVQDVIDGQLERNQWFGGEQPGLEVEYFWRTLEDGESFLVSYRDQDGDTSFRFAEPEQVTQPMGGDYREWSFGVQAPIFSASEWPPKDGTVRRTCCSRSMSAISRRPSMPASVNQSIRRFSMPQSRKPIATRTDNGSD